MKKIKINYKNKALILSCGFGIILLLIALLTNGFGFFSPEKIESVPEQENVITIPISVVSENAKWYEDEQGNRFFIVKAKNGKIKTAFDSCDICWQADKGYRQQGDYMVCNNCGLQFAISELGKENKSPGSGCWPRYLPHTITDNNVIIRLSDLTRNQQSNVCDPSINVCPI